MAEAGQAAALFRLEFGGATGWGHLVRSGALASELHARGWRCDLWTGSAVDSVPAELREPFARVVPFSNGGATVPAGYDWLVIDHYGTTDDEIRAWRAGCRGRILAIDDEARRRLDAADLVLNARLGLTESPYAPGVAALLGERFASLRRALREPSVPDWTPPSDAMPVLVMLGGTDPAGATGTVLEALADIDGTHFAPIVLRPGVANPGARAAEAVARFRSAVWLGGVNAGELAGWAGVCRFAVSAAGGALYELAALRLPFVSVVVAENQQALAAEITGRWGMPRVAAGPALRSDLRAAVRQLLADLEHARAAPVWIDGRGAERVADAMTQGAG